MTELVDITLIIVSYGAMSVILVLSHWYAWKVTVRLPGTGYWTLGFAGIVGSQFLYAVYLIDSAPAFAAFGYSLEILGFVLLARGCKIFILGKAGTALEAGVAAFGILASMVFTAIYPDLTLRLACGNLAFAFLLIRSAAIFNKNAESALRPTVYFVSLCLAVLAAIQIAQVAAVVASHDPGYYMRTKPTYIALSRLAYFGLMITLLQLSYARFQRQLAAHSENMRLLISELHHRTKNNLAIVQSLISLESGEFPEDGKVLDALDRIQARVRTIASLHEQLQHSKASSFVQAREYIAEILDHSAELAEKSEGKISIAGDIDDIELGIGTAIPIGLIVNELITNALKHAYPDGRPGQVRVRLEKRGEGLGLFVSDDGVGMPPCPKEGALGMTLIRALASQLGGNPSWETVAGTRFALVLPALAQAR